MSLADICHQEITDGRGYLDACNAPATGTRPDPDGGDDYPACPKHATIEGATS